MMAQIILDIIVISLLVTTIMFCWKLNGKIMELKDSKKSLKQLIKTFDIAIIKTHKSIGQLREASSTCAQDLQNLIDQSNDLISDLSFLNDRASKVADRIERNIEKTKLQTNAKLEQSTDIPIENVTQNESIAANIPPSNNNQTDTRSDVFKSLRDELIEEIRGGVK